MADWYALVSAFLLLFIAMIWSGKGSANIFIKILFTATALWGAVVVAKEFL